MKALILTLAEGLAGLTLLLLLVEHGPALVALFAVVLVLREAAERERTKYLTEKREARHES